MQKHASPGDALKFASRAVMHEGHDCVLWPYAKNRGYGVLYLNGKFEWAHRLVLSAWDGPAPPGHEACHSCDTPACINPLHLRWGTRQDNVTDMMTRRRHWSHTWQRP